jgi:serine/threonine protein kinase
MSAAEELSGLALSNGWVVGEQLARHPNGSGGTFSQSYRVEREKVTGTKKAKEVGFLKAFDFSDAFRPGANTTELIQILTSAYNFERDVLTHCKERRLSNIVLAIDHGHVQVPSLGMIEGRVFYLIFEMANGDVRCQLHATNKFDALWCMRALKDVCLGLWQVHQEMIAHQDVKPSNILSFPDGGFKVSDFGRSSWRGRSVWYDNNVIPGDQTYAPLELLYGFTHPDFIPRRVGCDLYMLGNLVAFLFSGVNVTSALLAKLDKQHHPRNWAGIYADVLPYLQEAFAAVLEEQKTNIHESLVRDDAILLINELCNPDLALRGHPKGIGRHDQYSLQRYVTRLDLLAKRLAVALRVKQPSA